MVSQLNDEIDAMHSIKTINEDFIIYFIGYSDTSSRVLCPIQFPFAFSGTDYTLTCSKIDLVNVGTFTTGVTVNQKYRSSALIILSRTSTIGDSYVGNAYVHFSRTI